MFQPNDGNFLEDFTPEDVLYHANPTTIDPGMLQAYKMLAFQPFAYYNDATFASDVFNMAQMPVDPAIVFHTVFGHSVPDVSFNAVANVGYGRGMYGKPVHVSDTIRSQSTVLGVTQHPKQQGVGTVYVRTEGFNQDDELVLGYNRWVQVRKRDENSIIDEGFAPSEDIAKPANLSVYELNTDMLPEIEPRGFLASSTGSPWAFEDFEPGTIVSAPQRHEMNAADSMQFTRLWNNSAMVHYADGKIIYGGFPISLSRNFTAAAGLANAGWSLGINSGAHENPIGPEKFATLQEAEELLRQIEARETLPEKPTDEQVAKAINQNQEDLEAILRQMPQRGQTLTFQAVVRDAKSIEGRDDWGALRIAYQAAKNYKRGEPFPTERSKAFKHDDKGRILDFDVWVAIPTRQSLDI